MANLYPSSDLCFGSNLYTALMEQAVRLSVLSAELAAGAFL